MNLAGNKNSFVGDRPTENTTSYREKQMTDNAELRGLISAGLWPAVVERAGSHQREVGSSHPPRDERGYTALHAVAAYNRASDGRELVPAVRAILRAADEIDRAAAFGVGGATDDGNGDGAADAVDGRGIGADGTIPTEDAGGGGAGGTGGSWRLRLDQSNRASWSPLHLVCVQGGIARGKVPMMKALLQMDEEDREGVSPFQHRILTLLDRQERNILHHLMDVAIPSEDSFDAVRFAVAMIPSLLFQRNNRGKTPLDYVLDRLLERSGTRRRHHMHSYGNDDEGLRLLKNYSMLKVLVDYMDRDVRGWGEVRSRNVLHSACLLPQHSCPSDGSLLTYLCSDHASRLEVKARAGANVPFDNLASEVDGRGNHALHLFLSNESYARGGNAETAAGDDSDAALGTVENKIMAALLNGNREAISIPDSNGDLPLRIAMKAGRRRAVTALLVEYPEAVFFDSSMLDIKLYVQVLGCISVPPDCFLGNDEFDGRDDGGSADDATKRAKVQRRCITIMFNLVRARPDLVSFAGSGTPELNEEAAKSNEGSKEGSLERKKMKKWWSNIRHLFVKNPPRSAPSPIHSRS